MASITKVQIEERLALLRRERQQLCDNANAYNGAIAECERWLALLAQDEKLAPILAFAEAGA